MNIVLKKIKMKEKPKPPSKEISVLPKIINGGIAGMIGVSVIFPLDLVKTRLQNQSIGPNGERQYKSMFDCFKKTYAAEGYFGMYRGSLVNIILVTPEKAIKLAANDVFRFYLTLPDGSLSNVRQMLAGGGAGAFQVLISTPMELLKIQMQDAGRVAAQAKAERTKIPKITALSITRRLIKERGIFGLYKGVVPTLGRDIIFSMIYFPMYATIDSMGPKYKNNESPFWLSFLAGFFSGTTSALAVTPFDVVKTRMQTLTKGSRDRVYTSSWDCIKKTLMYEGPLAFFKGGACRVIVLAPLYGIVQTVYYIGIAEWILGIERQI